MIFGPVPVAQALGAILAHSLPLRVGRLRKGMVLGPAEIAALTAEGLSEVTVARLEPGDFGEDAAAGALAQALVPVPDLAGLKRSEPFTGRVNLHATRAGIVEYDPAQIHALNRIDPAITFATLAPLTRVTPGMLAGTVKIISYGVSAAAIAEATASAHDAIRIRPVVLQQASLVQTLVPGQDARLTIKGEAAIVGRLHQLGMRLCSSEIVAHDETELSAALQRAEGEILLILTGSATSDLYDTGPEALRRAGGEVARFGMPVDPGNLLFLGQLGSRPVIGLPGCARSPALNGTDWVLERLACGLVVTDHDISDMGVGGLLKEIPQRPHPREPKPARISAAISGESPLAAVAKVKTTAESQ